MSSYLGYNTIGGTNGSYSAGLLIGGGRYQMPENGSITSIDLYTDNNTDDFTFGIYSDSAGAPANLLAQSAGGLLGGGTGFEWRVKTLSYSATSGTYYWLAVEVGANTFQVQFDVSVGKGIFVTSAYSAGNLPASYPIGGTMLNQEFSVRAAYTPTSSGVKVGSFLGMIW